MKQFSKWMRWENRSDLENLKFPGIYCIAISSNKLDGKNFEWIPEINYIGMTNSIKGLEGRLYQFHQTIIGKTGHGGAERFRNKYRNYNEFVNNLYVAVRYFKCDVKSNEPKDLKVMGEVVKFEYDCFAQYVQKFGALPEFNDKKRSPKYKPTHSL